MKFKQLLLPIAVVIAIMLGGIALAGVYPGNNLPITLRNNDNNTQYSGVLLGYGDVSGPVFAQQCFEGDNGIKPASGPFVPGNIFWVDGNNSYSFYDSCAGAIIHEFVCSKNVKYVDANGGLTQINNFVALVDVNCQAIGFTTCSDANTFAARCV